MRAQPTVLLAALAFFAIPLYGQQTLPDHATLATQLLSDDRTTRNRAFEAARGIQPPMIGAKLRTALISLLESQNRRITSASRLDEPLESSADPEFIAALSRLVADLQDPKAIPALAEAIYGGVTVMRALASFGEPAVAAVLKVVRSPESHYNAVNHGLTTLRFMVEGTPKTPLSSRSLEQIRRATEQRLTGNQYFTTVWQAIDLAVALKDPGLRNHVESLATDWNAIITRGLDEPEVAERTRQRAKERLAGVLPLPRPENAALRR